MSAPVFKTVRSDERGFTLLELLVATIAGLFVVLAAFMLSRGATRLFANEGRVAQTQFGLRLGIDRMRADIERAGYMTSANVRADPDTCPDPNTLGFAARLQSVYYEQGTAASAAIDAPISGLQGLYPDKLTLTGNYTSTDSYLVADVAPSAGGGGSDIYLQANNGAIARLYQMGEAGSYVTALQQTFPTDRMLRLTNLLGSSQYLKITGVSVGAGDRPIITVAAAPPLTLVTGGAVVKRCGSSGRCMGCSVNPVQTVQYSVKSLASSALYKWAYPDGGVATASKYDLVRTEMTPAGAPIANSEQIVAEYVVDLAFAFGVDDSAAATPGTPWTEPTLRLLAFGDANNAVWGADIITGSPTATRPQRIKTVRYRISTRTKEGDRTTTADDGGPNLMRYKIDTNNYARVRTIVGEVNLVNHQGIRW